MPRTSVYAKDYASRKKEAALRALQSARNQIIASRRSPASSGGGGGQWRRQARIGELKAIDVDVAAGTSTSGGVTLVNGVATGTDFTDRIGRAILMKSIYMRYFISGSTGGCLGNAIRVWLVYDKQPNGAAPAFTDIFKVASINTLNNLNNRDRFQILWDKSFTLEGNTITAGAVTAGSINAYCGKKFMSCNLASQFSGTGATIASIATGAIYFCHITNDGSCYDFSGSTRIRFTDS